jgi:hypothetical protein
LIAQAEKNYRKTNIFYWLLSAITLAVWMFPRHKLFDISLSIFLVGLLAFLIELPSSKRYFFTGFCIGLIATFGRNHGVYGVIGALGVMIWLAISQEKKLDSFKDSFLLLAGIVLGFAPIFLMAITLPGFAVSFLESIRFLFEIKATNLPLPVPWPWTIDFASVSLGDAIRKILVGLFFIGIVAFGILSVVWSIWQRLKNKPVPPALVAASFLSLPYAHYAYSRADIGHLAQGIFPFLIGTLIVFSTKSAKIKYPFALALAAASVWVMHVFHPGWQCYANKQCVNIEISNNNLQIDPGTANEIALLRQLAEKYAPNGQSFIVVPFWPGAYSLLERRSPMWEIYALFPRSAEFEAKEIEDIKAANPKFAFVFDFALDGRDELRFRNTHPLIHQYILDNFEPLQNSPNPAYQIYKAKRLE